MDSFSPIIAGLHIEIIVLVSILISEANPSEHKFLLINESPTEMPDFCTNF